MTATSRPRTGFPYLDEPHGQGIVAMAHRGGARHPDLAGLENTLTAFEHAVGLGYRYLETDVQATRDGHLLAFHDDHLDRLTGASGRVRDATYAEIGAMLVDGREPIPRLVDLLEAFPDVRFNVDLKSPGAVDPVIDLLVATGAHDRICVGSFNERLLRRFRSRLAGRGSRPVVTSCGVVAAIVHKFVPAGRHLQGLLRDTGSVYQVPLRHRGVPIVDRRFVEHAHAIGRHVHVWTVDDRSDMEHLLGLGVDGLITDRTDVLRDLLVERGQWVPADGAGPC